MWEIQQLDPIPFPDLSIEVAFAILHLVLDLPAKTLAHWVRVSERCRKMKYAVILIGLLLYACGNPPASEAPAEPPDPTEAPAAAPTAEPPTPTEEIATEESAIDPLGTGDLAPDFTLPDSNGNTVNLADSLLDNRLTILVFYFSHT